MSCLQWCAGRACFGGGLPPLGACCPLLRRRPRLPASRSRPPPPDRPPPHTTHSPSVIARAQINSAQWDFGLNWLHHIKAIQLDYYVLAAADASASARLAAAGEPCFEWLDTEAPKLGALL